MALERQYRPDDRALKNLADELAHSSPDVDVPGKATLAERIDQLAVLLRHRVPTAQVHARTGILRPGQRALVDELLTTMPKLEFRDCQALALRDVLSRLAKSRGLQQETIAAADPHIARRVAQLDRDHSGRPSLPTRDGIAMWGAANARAVTLYRRSLATGTMALGSPAIAAALNAIGSGASLDPEVCRKMERILGVRLDRVRIHTGKVAVEAAQATCSDAFTCGEDIFMPSYDPASPSCHKLLLHELVHCCQWWQGRIGPSARLSVSQPEDALEREAEAVVARAAFDGPAQHSHATARSSRGLTGDRKPKAVPATMVIGPVSPSGTGFASSSAMVMRKKNFVDKAETPLEVGAWDIQDRLNDLKKSILQAGPHIAEIGGEFGPLLAENWMGIAGGIAAGILGGIGLGMLIGSSNPVTAIVAAVGGCIVAAYGAWNLVDSAKTSFAKYQIHLVNWAYTGWNAEGREAQIEAASFEFARMITSFSKAVGSVLMLLGVPATVVFGAIRIAIRMFASKGSKAVATRPIEQVNPRAQLTKVEPAQARGDAGGPMLPAVRSEQPPVAAGQRRPQDLSKYPKSLPAIGTFGSGAQDIGELMSGHKTNSTVPAIRSEQMPSPSALGGSATLADTEPTMEQDLETVLRHMKAHLSPTDYAVYERFLKEAVYGGHETVQEVFHATPAPEWKDLLRRLRSHLVEGPVGAAAGGTRRPYEDHPKVRNAWRQYGNDPGRAGLQPQKRNTSSRRAAEALEEIDIALSPGSTLTIAKAYEIIRHYVSAFGYPKYDQELMARTPSFWLDPDRSFIAPFRMILPDGLSIADRDFNTTGVVGVGKTGVIGPKEMLSEDLDIWDAAAHDDLHHYTRAEMPQDARGFLRQAARQAEFFAGFEPIRARKSPAEQKVLDSVWALLTHEFPGEVDAVSFSLTIEGGGPLYPWNVAEQIASRYPSYSPQEIDQAIHTITEYANARVNASPEAERQLEFERALESSNWSRRSWFDVLQANHYGWWTRLAPEDYFDALYRDTDSEYKPSDLNSMKNVIRPYLQPGYEKQIIDKDLSEIRSQLTVLRSSGTLTKNAFGELSTLVQELSTEVDSKLSKTRGVNAVLAVIKLDGALRRAGITKDLHGKFFKVYQRLTRNIT